MKLKMFAQPWVLTLHTLGMALLLIGGGSIAVCCTMPEAVCLSLLAGDFAPLFLTDDSWLFTLWCLLVVGGAGIGVIAFDDLVGELTWRARCHMPRTARASLQMSRERLGGSSATDRSHRYDSANPAWNHSWCCVARCGL